MHHFMDLGPLIAMNYLPAELWTQIVQQTGPSDWNNLRLTGKWICDTVTPIRFREVAFTVSAEGIARLERLGLVSHLARYVRMCSSEAVPDLRTFNDIQDWEDAIDFDDSCDSDVMSKIEWSSLSTNTRKSMFKEYELERIEANIRVRYLWRRLCKALRRFPMLTKFVHRHGALVGPRFYQHWRTLRFKPCPDSISEVRPEHSFDSNTERLQLVCVWQALNQALPHLEMLRSMTWHVRKESLEDIAHSECGRAEKKKFGSTGFLLNAITHLDCFVYDYDEDDWSPNIGMEAFGMILSHASSVKGLRLRFGNCPSRNGRLDPLLMQWEVLEGRCALLGRLAHRRPWPRIRMLELGLVTDTPRLLHFLDSIAASLEHLVLVGMTLLPAQYPHAYESLHDGNGDATWEVVLIEVSRVLPRLQKLEIERLIHYPGGRLELFAPQRRGFPLSTYR